jgi:DNA invertase Pin-like site-specific DNA recombinase
MLRLRLKAGKASKALAGGYVGGAPPYGYAAVKGQLVPLPDEQKGLKLMRRLRKEGVSYRSIAVELSRRGFPSRAPSGQWRPGTIHEILSRAEMRQQARAIASPSPEIVEVSA